MRCESQPRSSTDRTTNREHSSGHDDSAGDDSRDVGDARDQQTEDQTDQQTDNQTQQQTDGKTDQQADDQSPTDAPPVDLSQDLLFDALQNERRRETITYLRANDGSATLGELAEHIAAIENETTVQALTSQQRKRVYVGLYQGHLPKLDGMDVVEFDQNRGDVTLGPNAAQLYPYLPSAEADESRPWDLYYLGYAATAVALVGTATAGNLLTLPGIALLSISVTILCALVLAHVASCRR